MMIAFEDYDKGVRVGLINYAGCYARTFFAQHISFLVICIFWHTKICGGQQILLNIPMKKAYICTSFLMSGN